MQTVEDVEARADQKEEGELNKDDDAGREKCEARFTQAARGEHPLDHELIRPVRGHRQERPADNSGPEGIGLREVDRKIEPVELARRACHLVNRRPAPGDVRTERADSDSGSGNIDAHLDDVCPDDGSHASLKRIKQREQGDDADREDISRTDGDADHNRDGEDPNTLRRSARQQEQPRGHFMQRRPEALIDELVGCQHVPAKVLRQKKHGDDDAPDHVAEDDLQEAHVSREGHAGNRDDRERAGLGRDNRERDGPPGDGVVGEEVGLEALGLST